MAAPLARRCGSVHLCKRYFLRHVPCIRVRCVISLAFILRSVKRPAFTRASRGSRAAPRPPSPRTPRGSDHGIFLQVERARRRGPLILIEGQPTDPIIQPRAESRQRLPWKSRQRVQFRLRQLQPGIEARCCRVLEESVPKAFIRNQFAECFLHCCLAHRSSPSTLRSIRAVTECRDSARVWRSPNLSTRRGCEEGPKKRRIEECLIVRRRLLSPGRSVQK